MLKRFFALALIFSCVCFILAKAPFANYAELPKAHHNPQLDNRQALSSARSLLAHRNGAHEEEENITQAKDLLEGIMERSDVGPDKTVNSARYMLASILEQYMATEQNLARARNLMEEYLQHNQQDGTLIESNRVLYQLAHMETIGLGGPINNFRAFNRYNAIINNYARYPELAETDELLLQDARIAYAQMLIKKLISGKNPERAVEYLDLVIDECKNSQDAFKRARANDARLIKALYYKQFTQKHDLVKLLFDEITQDDAIDENYVFSETYKEAQQLLREIL